MSVKTIELRSLKDVQKAIQDKCDYAANIFNEVNSDPEKGPLLTYDKAQKIRDKTEKEVAFLRKCWQYLEDGKSDGGPPREIFVAKELERMETKLALINNGFGDYVSNQAPRHSSREDYRPEYNTLMGVKTIKAQIKTLKYLLNMIEI